MRLVRAPGGRLGGRWTLAGAGGLTGQSVVLHRSPWDEDDMLYANAQPSAAERCLADSLPRDTQDVRRLAEGHPFR